MTTDEALAILDDGKCPLDGMTVSIETDLDENGWHAGAVCPHKHYWRYASYTEEADVNWAGGEWDTEQVEEELKEHSDRLPKIEERYSTDYYVLFDQGKRDMGWLIEEVKRLRHRETQYRAMIMIAAPAALALLDAEPAHDAG